ncbi:MAG: carbohydrate porin [Alphaproteobacteria bacterium]|nr:carbohydrate porin [Alphaproteobacteria bacterium]
MLWRHVVSARHVGNHRARHHRLGDNPPSLFVRPPPLPANARPNLDAPAAEFCVDYVHSHICKTIPRLIAHRARHARRSATWGQKNAHGRLPHYGTEDILEVYYSAQLTAGLTASADCQLVANPAYNRDRGPVSVLAARLHIQI